VRVDFLGSDDFTTEDKGEAARAINAALLAGWDGMSIAERFSLQEVATAHERLEAPRERGRVVVIVA
jgi:NADPH:quinone reductase